MTTPPNLLAAAKEHYQSGRLAEAESLCDQLLSANPANPRAWHLLATIAHERQDFPLAAKHSQQALRLHPDYPEAHYNLGLALEHQGDLAAAQACYEQALALAPSFAEAHNNLGNLLKDQLRFDAAAAHYRLALQAKPAFPAALTNLGDTLKELGFLDEAVVHSQRALDLSPDFAEAHNNLGTAFQELGQFENADVCFRRALDVRPDCADANWNLAHLQMLQGDFQRGLEGFEWRWRKRVSPPRRFDQLQWTGKDITGKLVLLYAEEGLGDTIQFMRYAPLVVARGANVVIECQSSLFPLLRNALDLQIIAAGSPLPHFDCHASLLALPRIFDTRLTTVPASLSYLRTSPVLVALWRERLRSLRGLHVGIAWQGNPQNRADRKRSIPVAQFQRLAEMPGITLVNLQAGPAKRQLDQLQASSPVPDLGDDFDRSNGPFMDTAAVMHSLDLVITCDTAIAHLAGALGVPVWVALPYVPDWRWLLHRTDSPWYPTMRLFRQPRPGDWDGVFAEMKAHLQRYRVGGEKEASIAAIPNFPP